MHYEIFIQFLRISGRNSVVMQPGAVEVTHLTTGDKLWVYNTDDSEDRLIYYSQSGSDGRFERLHCADLREAFRVNKFID